MKKECGRVYLSPTVHVIRLDNGLSLLTQQSTFAQLTDEGKDWQVDEIEDHGEL